MMMAIRPAKEEGFGVSYLESVSMWQLALGAAGGLGHASIAIGLDVVPAVIAVGCVVGVMGVLAIRKIRGISGDLLGATEQVSESAVLLTLV